MCGIAGMRCVTGPVTARAVCNLLWMCSMQGAPSVSNQQATQWLNAAKLGETDTLATLLQENPALLRFKVQQLTKPAIFSTREHASLHIIQDDSVF